MIHNRPVPFHPAFADARVLWKPLVFLSGVALLIRLLVFLVGWAHADPSGNHPAFYWYDSWQYLNPARSLLEHGTYTVDSGGTQIPYFTRAIGYPAFIVACFALAGDHAASVLLPQIVMGALACGFTFWMAAILFGKRVGLIAGWLMVLDQTLIAYSSKLMTETFCLFFLTASALLFALFLAKRIQPLLWLSGISLGISTLAHSSSLYYWVVPAVALTIWDDSLWKRKIGGVAVLAVSFYLTIATWQVRNWIVFGVYQVTPKGTVLEVTAARAIWLDQSEKSREEVANEFYAHIDGVFSEQTGIEKEKWKDWTDAEIRKRHFHQFLNVQNQESIQAIKEHLPRYLRMVGYSLLKITVAPLPYAEICRFAQSAEEETDGVRARALMTSALKDLFRGEPGEFWAAFRQLPFCKLFGFGWNAAYWIVTIPPALLGVYLALRRLPWFYTIFFAGSIAYFALTTSLTMAGDGMQRYRLRTLPYLFCLAAVGWSCRSPEYRSASKANPPPNL